MILLIQRKVDPVEGALQEWSEIPPTTVGGCFKSKSFLHQGVQSDPARHE